MPSMPCTCHARRVADDHRFLQIHQHRLLESAQQVGLAKEVWREAGHGVEFAQGRFGNPAVTLAEDADEERLDAVDPLPAVFPGVGRLAIKRLGRHPPAQVHVEELQTQLLHPLAQVREDDGDQMVPLRVHIAEGTAYKYSNRFPGDGHRHVISLSAFLACKPEPNL